MPTPNHPDPAHPEAEHLEPNRSEPASTELTRTEAGRAEPDRAEASAPDAPALSAGDASAVWAEALPADRPAPAPHTSEAPPTLEAATRADAEAGPRSTTPRETDGQRTGVGSPAPGAEQAGTPVRERSMGADQDGARAGARSKGVAKARALAGALDGPAAHVRVRSGGPLWLAAGEPAPPGMVRLTRPDSTGQALPVWPDGVTPSLLEEYQVAPVPVERSGETRRVLAAVLKCCWPDLSVDPWPGEPAPVELVLDTYRALIGRTDDLMRNWAIGAMRRLHDSAWIVVDDGVVTLGPRCALWPVESHAQLQELVRRLPEPERPELTVVGDADIVAAAHPAETVPDPEAGLGGRVEGGSAEFDDLLGAYDERRRAELVAAFMVVEHAAEPVQEVRFAALRDPALRHTLSEMLARRGRTLIQHRDRWTSGYDDTQAAALTTPATITPHKAAHEVPPKAAHEAAHDGPHEAPRKTAHDGGREAAHEVPREAAHGASEGAGSAAVESLSPTGAAVVGEAGEGVDRAGGGEPVAARAVGPAGRSAVPAGARLGVSERAVLTLVLVHSVAIPRAEGLLPEDSWLSPHPTPVDELRRHTQLPIGELEAALRVLRHAGLLGQVKAGEEAGGYVPGPQFHRLTPAARRRLQEELILAAGPNTPLASAVRARRSAK
ncbi:hypothetical protein ACIBI9_07475 [Nonomuraea sp. NPDC050451]|uniref:hypothetical protein n=1 Tax=Nonomuraea sp. NPDC050451 TaxID=3364364 RepID=UPI00379911CF